MFLGEPGQTPYDLKFNIFGFPVRVHPAFFILPVLFSQNFMQPGMNAGVGILVISAVFFLAVLVHELGHTIAFRYFGVDSHIVLYWMGGLAIPGGGMGAWGRGARTKSLKPNEQIIVSLAGPVAGLLLAAVFVLILFLITGNLSLRWLGPFPLPRYDAADTILENSQPLDLFIFASIVINVVLNLFNLLPVFPMDGGQISRQLFVKGDPWGGLRKSVILSMCVAIGIAVYAMSEKETFMGIFFGFMAWSNFQMLNGMAGGGGGRRPW